MFPLIARLQNFQSNITNFLSSYLVFSLMIVQSLIFFSALNAFFHSTIIQIKSLYYSLIIIRRSHQYILSSFSLSISPSLSPSLSFLSLSVSLLLLSFLLCLSPFFHFLFLFLFLFHSSSQFFYIMPILLSIFLAPI